MPRQPDEIEHQDFSVRLRGFDPTEVRSFLASVADDLRASSGPSDPLGDGGAEDPEALLDEAKHLAAAVVEEAERRAALAEEEARGRAEAIEADARGRAEAIAAEAAERAARAPEPPSPPGDLGEQIAAVLTTANNEAESTIRSAQAEAERILSRARADAERIRSEARPAISPATEAGETRYRAPGSAGFPTPGREARAPLAASAGGEERSAVATEAIRAIVQLVLDVDHRRAPAGGPDVPRGSGPPPSPATVVEPAPSPSPVVADQGERAPSGLEDEPPSPFAWTHGPDDGISRAALASHRDPVDALDLEADPEDEPVAVIDLRDAATAPHRPTDEAAAAAGRADAANNPPHPPAPDWTQE